MMKTDGRVEQFARQFPENGMKLLLQNPRNVHDLLVLAGRDLVQLIDTDRMRPVQTTFVRRDYRHVESDIVLVAPYRHRRGRSRRQLLVYILIEHQSTADQTRDTGIGGWLFGLGPTVGATAAVTSEGVSRVAAAGG